MRLLTLHRYFLTASWMRDRFYEFVETHPDFTGEDDKDFTEFFAYLSLWYASLWVALDGWRQQGVRNFELDALMADEQFGKLKDFRDATMHYRPDYFDRKHTRFFSEEDSVEWVNEIQHVLGLAIMAGLEETARSQIVRDLDDEDPTPVG